MQAMAQNASYYKEKVKQEPMSPILYRSEAYTNGVRIDSDGSEDDSHSEDAPIDFSIRRHVSDDPPVSLRPMMTNVTQSVDSTSPSPTSNIHTSQYGSPPALYTRIDVDSESSSASSSSPYNHSVKETEDNLPSNAKSKSSRVYNNSTCLPHESSMSAVSSSPVSANATGRLPPMTALCEQRITNGGLNTDDNAQVPINPSLAQETAMQFPMNYFGLPGFAAGFQNMNPNALVNINKTTGELLDMYKTQLKKIQNLEAQKRYRGLGSLGLFTAQCPISPPALSPENTGVAMNHGQSTSPDSARHFSGTGMNSSGVTTTSSMARRRPRSLPDEQKDGAYWERRRKNNEAAKRSRDTRRAKEDEIAIRAAILEQENIRLRLELSQLKTETAKLKYSLYSNN